MIPSVSHHSDTRFDIAVSLDFNYDQFPEIRFRFWQGGKATGLFLPLTGTEHSRYSPIKKDFRQIARSFDTP